MGIAEVHHREYLAGVARPGITLAQRAPVGTVHTYLVGLHIEKAVIIGGFVRFLLYLGVEAQF